MNFKSCPLGESCLFVGCRHRSNCEEQAAPWPIPYHIIAIGSQRQLVVKIDSRAKDIEAYYYDEPYQEEYWDDGVYYESTGKDIGSIYAEQADLARHERWANVVKKFNWAEAVTLPYTFVQKSLVVTTNDFTIGFAPAVYLIDAPSAQYRQDEDFPLWAQDMPTKNQQSLARSLCPTSDRASTA